MVKTFSVSAVATCSCDVKFGHALQVGMEMRPKYYHERTRASQAYWFLGSCQYFVFNHTF